MRKVNINFRNTIIEYINDCYFNEGRNLTVQEIADHFRMSKSNIYQHLNGMFRDGMLDSFGTTRGIRTKEMARHISSDNVAPIVGRIACGTPMFASENIDGYVNLPRELVGRGNYFFLRASGESMINAGIEDNDLVLIRRQDTADEGQIVVARIGEDATLKRLRYDRVNRRIVLHPENDNMSDMYFDSIDIQGVAVKVVKNVN